MMGHVMVLAHSHRLSHCLIHQRPPTTPSRCKRSSPISAVTVLTLTSAYTRVLGRQVGTRPVWAEVGRSSLTPVRERPLTLARRGLSRGGTGIPTAST